MLNTASCSVFFRRFQIGKLNDRSYNNSQCCSTIESREYILHVLITGAGGFLGRRLTSHLLKNPKLADRDGIEQTVRRLSLCDIAPFEALKHQSIDIEVISGDLSQSDFISELVDLKADSIFHFASQLTLLTEQDPGTAFRINVEALRLLLDGVKNQPKVIFTSSIAVFGGELPQAVGDDVPHAPATSYGTHKSICELLLADYSRHDRADGRALRLPIVVTRPGAPLPVVSDRIAALIREPLSGNHVDVPLSADTRIPIASVGAIVRALEKLHDLPAEQLPARRATNLPSLTVSVEDIISAVERHGGSRKHYNFVDDAQMQSIVDSWPTEFVSDHAASLGLGVDRHMDDVIEDFLKG